ncbi:dynamin family protein [Rossellomorea vietnamensis]|uniref:dynamin family protein n=1 Tax=Rossellomorea vietnamensis TaxID=218284 RepID=UPI003CED3F1B
MEDLNLKAIREKLNLTQSELAAALEVGQETISRLEKNPKNMSIELFMKLCQVTNMLPNDLLNQFKLAKPKVMDIPNVYEKSLENKKRFKQYIDGHQELLTGGVDSGSGGQKISELMTLINTYSFKPLVALFGPSDAGKSTLINSLTGIETLLSQWTPTTSATVYLKHIEDKPAWMGTDEVAIFRAESKENGWNFRKMEDDSYCRKHKIVSGDYDLLQEYCNRNSSEVYKEVDSAVVYLDSPLLKACDMVDLPGFGTEELNDTIQSQRAREQADIVLFLCQSNSFFNKMNDIVFLKEVIRNLAATNNEHMPLMSNLFIIASQAHIVEDSIDKVLSRGRDVISKQMSEEVIEQFFNTTKEHFVGALANRFFTYSLEKPSLRADFEEDFKKLLVTVLPPIKREQLNHAVEQFKQEAAVFYENQIKKYKAILSNHEQVKEQYEHKIATKDSAINEILQKKNQLNKQINVLSLKGVQELRDWESLTLTKSRLISLINRHQYDKKQAQEFLPSNLSDLYYARLQEILRSSTDIIQDDITTFFEEMEGIANSIVKINIKGESIPFDFKGAVTGGFAGATVLGALGFWASTVGNLGGYILVAKGVSLLSALGISVGGTAAAASFVSIIGGPITLGIGIALGTFFLIKGIFGDGWKDRIANQLIKAFKKENVLQSYEKTIAKYWSDTKEALEIIVNNIIEKTEEQLEHYRSIIEADDMEEIQVRITYSKQLKELFDGLPWGEAPVLV